MSFRDYLNRCRILEYMRLRKEKPDMSTATAAEASGFGSVKSFYRAKKKFENEKTLREVNYEKKRFDLNLNSWGPYNKDFLGVCHIADEDKGATFNVELFPGLFRRTVMLPVLPLIWGLKCGVQMQTLRAFPTVMNLNGRTEYTVMLIL